MFKMGERVQMGIQSMNRRQKPTHQGPGGKRDFRFFFLNLK